MSWESLPKFLVCSEECNATTADRSFVLHTQRPRFLLEIAPGGPGELRKIDPCDDEALLRQLRAEAQDFFCGE